MEHMTLVLAFSGMLAGSVNFFVSYLELPFPKPDTFTEGDDWPKIKTIWVAILGYLIVGIAGATLVPLVNVIVNLKGLEITNNLPNNPMYDYILFGYGLVFGYSTARLLLSLLDSIIKRLSKVEFQVGKHQTLIEKSFPLSKIINSNAQKIIDSCESCFDANKGDCSGFVKAVASEIGVALIGQADDIIDQLKSTEWISLSDGIEAKEKADDGCFVVAGLKGADNIPPQEHGHVAVIVSGPLAFEKYPTGYWGKLGSQGMKNTTINYAWNIESRDQVLYFAKKS